MSQANGGQPPRRQQRALRSHGLRERGLTWEQIADVWEIDYPNINPRVAFRWAHDLTHQQVAERWNLLDPGLPTMTKSRIYEFEAWPQRGRRPSPQTLRMLARIFQTTARRLLTADEYARFDQECKEEIDSINHRDVDPNSVIHVRELNPPPLLLGGARFVAAPSAGTGRSARQGSRGSASSESPGTDASPREDPVRRREFGKAAIGITLALPLAGIPNGEVVDISRLRAEQAVSDLYALDDRYGSAAVVDIARRRLASLKRQVARASLKPSLETHAHTMIGALATCASWLLYDASSAPQARVLDAEALYAAHLANNRDLQIEVLASMSMQANGSGRSSEAMNLAESAMEIARTADPRLRSLLAMRAGIAAAYLGDQAAFRRARAESWRLLEQSRENDRPAWFHFFDDRELMGLEALSLMQLGRYREAANILDDVVGRQLTYLRNRAYYTVVLAEALIGAKEPEGAALTLQEARPAFTEVTSTRIFDRLKKVRVALRPFLISSRYVAECDDVLSDLLG